MEVQVDIEARKLQEGLRLVLAEEVIFVVACTLAKLSIMQLVRQEMSCASAFWRGVVILSTSSVILQGLISALLVIFQCG